MIRSALVDQLQARRDNDVTVEIRGIRVPVTGARYCPIGDQIVLDLDPDELACALADDEPVIETPEIAPTPAAARYAEARAQGRDQVESLARALIPGIPS